LSKSNKLKVGFFFFFSLGWNQFSTLLFSLILWDFFLLCRKQTQWWWNPLRKRKKKKKLTLCETLSSRVSCSTIPKHFKLLAYEIFYEFFWWGLLNFVMNS
jgi:hypothetical protein